MLTQMEKIPTTGFICKGLQYEPCQQRLQKTCLSSLNCNMKSVTPQQHNCFIPLVILCVFYTGVHECRQWLLGGILSTLEISDHLQQSANPRIALQLFMYGLTEYYLRLGLMMPFKVFPSLIFICPTCAHCKHTVTHPSSGVLVKIKAHIS